MKQFLFAVMIAVLGLGTSAQVNAMTLRPIADKLDVDNLPDNEYAVSFDPKKVTKAAEGYYIDFEIYTLEVFDGVKVIDLSPGDVVVTSEAKIRVKDVEGELDYLMIKGDGGAQVDLMRREDGNYVVCGDDDRSTLSYRGTTRLFVPMSIVFMDGGVNGDPMATKEVKGKDLGRYFTHSWLDQFDEFNTYIILVDGQIDGFGRHYTP